MGPRGPGRDRVAALKVGVFGYAMNDMGDIRVDENALLRALGPRSASWRRATCGAAWPPWPGSAVAEVMEWENGRFEIDENLSKEEREDHARMQVAIEGSSRTAGTGRTGPTSTPSARTGGSPGCRWPPPRH